LFGKPPVILKIVPKAGYDMYPEKIDHDSERKPEQEFSCGFRRTILELACVVSKKLNNFILFVSFPRQPTNFKTI